MNRQTDLASLPDRVQHAARLTNSGREVMWHRTDAAAAVAALAAAGHVVLGLDVRRYDEHDTFIEAPWSAFEPLGDARSLDAARGRQVATDALIQLEAADLDEYDWVLVTW